MTSMSPRFATEACKIRAVYEARFVTLTKAKSNSLVPTLGPEALTPGYARSGARASLTVLTALADEHETSVDASVTSRKRWSIGRWCRTTVKGTLLPGLTNQQANWLSGFDGRRRFVHGAKVLRAR